MKTRSILDKIDEALIEYNWNNDDEAVKLVLDTYSYALLFEELGLSPDDTLSEYHGLVIKVDPDIDDLCQIL